MTKWKVRLACLICVQPLFLAPAITYSATPPGDALALGMDVGGMTSKTLDGIHSLHATWFRMVPPNSINPQVIQKFADLIRDVKQHDLKILIDIGQADPDYDNDNEDAPRNKCGWKEKKLSRINVSRFTQRLHQIFDAFKADGVVVDAFEIGNEDDSYCFNADVPHDHEPSPAEVMTALHGYGEFLKAAALVIRDPRYFPQAKLITFGIAHSGDKLNRIPDPASFVARLRNVNGFNYLDNAQYHVDGYGTHVYAWPGDVIGSVNKTLRQDAAALGRDKPFWVTEWGFLNPKAFPTASGLTFPQALQEFLGGFKSLSREMPIGPIMFYRYDVFLTDEAGNWLPGAHVFENYANGDECTKSMPNGSGSLCR